MSKQGYPWGLLLLPAVPILLGIFAWRSVRGRTKNTATRNHIGTNKISETTSTSTPIALGAAISSLLLLFGACFASITLFVMLNLYSNYFSAQAMLREDRTLTVEGNVTGYTRSTTGKDPGSAENFYVSGVRFSYSHWSESMGFHTVGKYGGPIREGLQVRIHYAHLPGDPSEPAILELEIKR